MEKRDSFPQEVRWPRNDYSRVPYWLYHDRALYDALIATRK